MSILDLSSEEKQQLLDSLLSERLKDQPESKRELIDKIESLTTSEIEREIESWAKSDNY